jgi:mercuric reductase
MASKRPDFDLIVIGSGAGGGVGANYAASRGKKVAIFEREAIGGECPNWGCVPTKALLHAADTYESAMEAAQYGIHTGEVKYDYQQVKKWKDLVVSRTGTAEGAKVFTDEGIKYFTGEARFVSPHEVEISGSRLKARHFLIATGSEVFIPPIPGLAEAGYITFREAVDFFKLPKSIFVLGGGAIGCEFAQLFSTFGVKIHIADITPRLLAREDIDIGDLVGALFSSRGIEVLTESAVVGVEKKGGSRIVHYEHKGQRHSVKVDEVLVATGKRPVTNIGLEAAGVKYSRAGITVNRQMQTSQPHIYAAGDCVGPFLFTHTAAYQSKIAAHNMFSRRKLRTGYGAIPRAIFVKPEVAAVGLSEQDAKGQHIRYRVGAAPINILGRANTANELNGFVKVLVDSSGVIIGASIVSPRAGEMIHQLALAIKLKATAREVAEMVHAFPTFSEAIKFACAQVA